MISGETLEDYFRLLNLDETRRKYLENIKEGKQVDREIEEHLFKNGNRKQHTVNGEQRYSTYIKTLFQESSIELTKHFLIECSVFFT